MQRITYKNGDILGNAIFIKDSQRVSIRRYAFFKCHCGNTFEASVHHVKRKKISSCGCTSSLNTIKSLTTHGLRYHPLYKVWRGMKDRCYRQKNKAFKNYGARGIAVCDEWINDFKKFFDWCIVNGYETHLTIDRIDNDGNYEPSNCRWVSCSIQSRNCRILRKSNTSGFKGVCFNKKTMKWNTRVCVDRKSNFLGIFDSIVDAAIAYDSFVIANNLEHSRNFNG